MMSEPMLQVGSIVGGKFRIERILGQGGMGVVAVATHLQLEQTVAIKVLHDQIALDPQTNERFLREARSSARLKNEHVCKVSDVGTLETGEPYMVMELLEGSDLQTVQEQQGRLPVDVAVDYVLQGCVAIAEAHALGIVHRDLKPANLFLTHRMDGSPLIKVLDFGIAKSTQATELKMTRTATIMGSPGYMSPEQLRSSRDVDARTDIWALGVILYELVSGRLPFVGESITELAVKVSIDPPEPLDVQPQAFCDVVMHCLQKDAAQRYQSVADFAADLAPFGGEAARRNVTLIASIAGGERTSRPVTTPASPAAGVAPTVASTLPGTAPPRGTGPAHTPSAPVARQNVPTTLGSAASQAVAPAKKRPVLFLGAGLLLVGAAATAAVIVVRTQSSSSPQPPPPPPPLVADAAIAVAPPDAPMVATTPLDAAIAADLPELRAKLQTLAKSHDWYAVLQLADLGKGDPEITPIVDQAKHEYTAQQNRAIDAAIKQGQCARARELADTAGKVLADDTSFATRAKTCKPIEHPPPPPPPTLDAAKQAYTAGDYAKALEIADKLVKADASNFDAAKVAAMAACNLKDLDKAKFYAAKLTGSDKNIVKATCVKAGVQLEPQTPNPLASQIEEAEDAAQQGDYGKAFAVAEQVLLHQPKNTAMITVAAASACHLRKAKRARMLILRLPLAKQDAARAICASEGVSLPPPE